MNQLLIMYFTVVGLTLVNGRRVKRVIDGSPVLDIQKTDYSSIRYFVTIGSGHNCDTPIPDFVSSLFGKPKNYEIAFIKSWWYYIIGRVCAPEPRHLLCTGSLLTPFLVQTACHCVAGYHARGNKVYPRVDYAIKYNEHELGYTVHPGRRFVADILVNEGVFIRHFIIHPKCRAENGVYVHDYALLVLHSTFENLQKFYAPIYSTSNLVNMWLMTQARALVCLNIGFGFFKWNYEEDEAYFEPSDVLRHGWTQALNYRECYEKFLGFLLANYTQEATFFCTRALQNRPYQANLISGKGDSGGPVTCNNQYVGLVSTYTSRYEKYKNVYYDKRMSTAFSVYENSIEYRVELSYRIHELYGSHDPFKDLTIHQSPAKMYSRKTSNWLSSGAPHSGNINFVGLPTIIILILSLKEGHNMLL